VLAFALRLIIERGFYNLQFSTGSADSALPVNRQSVKPNTVALADVFSPVI